jgi:TnpA family transposase
MSLSGLSILGAQYIHTAVSLYPIMTLKEILTPDLEDEFERPPAFSFIKQRYFFVIPIWMKPLLRGLVSDTNRVGFLLQWGYFRASGRFFKTSRYVLDDVKFVSRLLKCSVSFEQVQTYDRATVGRHRELIRTELGVAAFQGAAKEMALLEVRYLVTRQVSPSAVFGSLCEFIRTHRIEVPTYHTLAVLITKAFNEFEQNLFTLLRRELVPQQVALIDSLFDKLERDGTRRETYLLSSLRQASEIMKLADIRENMARFKQLKNLYHSLQSVLVVLGMSDDLVEHYAQYVLRAEIFQIKRHQNSQLLTLCFIQFQYFHLSDILLLTFKSSVGQILNQIQGQRDKLIFASYGENLPAMDTILESYLTQADLVNTLMMTAFSLDKTRQEKFDELIKKLNEPSISAFLHLVPSVKKLHQQTRKTLANTFLHQAMREHARVLMTRVADIMRHLEFCSSIHNDSLWLALLAYQHKHGVVTITAPTDFLSSNEKKIVENEGNFDAALYKVWLADYLIRALKSGRITVRNSHQHRAFDDHLVPQAEWETGKQTLLERAALRHLSHWPTVQESLIDRLTDQFTRTFDRINSGENLLVRKRADGRLRFVTPTKAIPQDPLDLYPKDRIFPIFEVFHTVNRYTAYTNYLQHRQDHNHQQVMPDIVNFAAMIGWGCNLGMNRMAQRSRNVSQGALDRVALWYFSPDNLRKANDCLVEFMHRMPIANLFKEDESIMRSASDGQKYTMTMDSIHATYSAKYFGKDKGITIYSFIAENYPLFYTTTFSAGDREAWYVFDGLLHHQQIISLPQQQVHSTDTHGVSLVNFALGFLLGIDFQPRIEGFHKCKLHGIADMPILQQIDYTIRADKTINTALIQQQWDNIQRFVVSLKLRYALPSTLLKRLNSYAHQHPMYQALVELGKVVRTIFLLNYMDDGQLRRQTQQQTTQMESIQKLAKVLDMGDEGGIQFCTKEELMIMALSKQLIINNISCFNYILLTKRLLDATHVERKELIDTIPFSAAFAWEHINLHGEYDFGEDVLKDAMTIDLEKLLNFEISRK